MSEMVEETTLIATPILRIKSADGRWIPIPAIQGSKGDKGDTGDQGIAGEKGDKGDTGMDAWEVAKTYGGYTGTREEYYTDIVDTLASVETVQQIKSDITSLRDMITASVQNFTVVEQNLKSLVDETVAHNVQITTLNAETCIEAKTRCLDYYNEVKADYELIHSLYLSIETKVSQGIARLEETINAGDKQLQSNIGQLKQKGESYLSLFKQEHDAFLSVAESENLKFTQTVEDAEIEIEEAKEEAIKEIEEAGGAVITVDEEISSESTNPIQNQWLGKRMGATSTNSVQIGYNAKAGTKSNQAIDGDGGDNGYQVAVGRNANGSAYGTAVGYNASGSSNGAAVGRDAIALNYGAAVGRDARGSSSGAAVGYNANGSSSGAAVGYNAKTTAQGAVAVGYFASADSSTPIVIGGSQLANTAQITVSSDGTLKVGGKEISGGGGNTEVWNGTIDSIDGVTDDMIGAKPLSNGNYPRLHARNKEIHGCKGFSNETGDYTGQELLLPWEVAMTNESSYLMAAVKFQANRGFGTQTFVQPLVPKETGAASAYFPYALPAFEDSPVYWKGHFIYSNARQMFLPWDKISTGGSGTLALTSDIPDASEFLANSGTDAAPKLSGDTGVEITTKGANGISIYSNIGGVANGFVLNTIGLATFYNGAVLGVIPWRNVYNSLKNGFIANNGCCFTPVANTDDSLAFTISCDKTLYTASIVTDALETTFSIVSKGAIASGEACVVWVKIKIASTLTTAPTITVPNTIQFMGDAPTFGIGTECMLALMSTDQGATWVANTQWEKQEGVLV